MESAAVGEGVAAEPFGFDPAGVLAVEGADFDPVALDIEDAEVALVGKGEDGLGVGGGRPAQGEAVAAVVAGADGDDGAVDPGTGGGV